MKSVAGALAVLFVILGQSVHARENATSAFQVLAIKDCELCTLDEDSVFCSEGKGFIENATMLTYVNYAQNGDPAPGEFCWEGTFGTMLRNKGNYSNILGSLEWVQADLSCPGMKLYYNNCIIASTLAIILMVVGGIVFTIVFFSVLVCFGFCKCGTQDTCGCCMICRRHLGPVGPFCCPCCGEIVTELDEEQQKKVQEGLFAKRDPIEEEARLKAERSAKSKKEAKKSKFAKLKKKTSMGSMLDSDSQDLDIEMSNPLHSPKTPDS